MVRNAMKIDYDDRIFHAKIRGYEVKEEKEVTPMTKGDWRLAMKEIKKKQLDFERNKSIIEIRRKRFG